MYTLDGFTVGYLRAFFYSTVSRLISLLVELAFDHVSPQRQRPRKSQGVITYVSLHPRHLLGINELLCRGFWSGIDVSDAMEHAPETSTVVALYNSLVVGAALLSSPFETYLTFLVVRAGWEDAGIATCVTYICLNTCATVI